MLLDAFLPKWNAHLLHISCAYGTLKTAAGYSFLEHYILIWWQTTQRTHTGKNNLSLICSCASGSTSFIFEISDQKIDKGMCFLLFCGHVLCARAELTVTITSRELPSELYTGKQMSLLYNSSKIVTGSSICTQYKLPHTADTSGDVAWDLWQQLRSNKLALIAQLSRSCLLRKLIQQLVLTPGPPEGCSCITNYKWDCIRHTERSCFTTQ